MMPAPGRVPEVDWLKGFAILCVLLIHARPLSGTAVFVYVVNRAVPIFIVLFGATSELWWRRQRRSDRAKLVTWFRTRFWRLMVPVWGTLAVWWAVSVAFDPATPFSTSAVAATAIGYLRWVGTGWFVTLILQLVLFFPALHLAVEWLGAVPCLAMTLTLVFWAHLYNLAIIAWMRAALHESPSPGGAFYYFWIFPVTHFFSVTAGIVMARRWLGSSLTKVRVHDVLFVATVLVVGFAIRSRIADLSWANAIQAGLDAPLTAALLIAATVLRRWPVASRMLAWCGAASWGLYLGQLLVHTSFRIFGFKVDQASVPVQWAYFFALLVGAIGLVTIGEAVRNVDPSEWVPRFMRPGIEREPS